MIFLNLRLFQFDNINNIIILNLMKVLEKVQKVNKMECTKEL
jgi:hypothetical protein